MSTWGDNLRNSGRRDFGIGIQQDPKDLQKLIPIEYASFMGGLNTSDGPEDLKPDEATSAEDSFVIPGDALVAAPGAFQLFDATPRSMVQLFEHSNIDGNAEPIAFDPPNMITGAGGTVTNIGIAGGADYTALGVAGVLLFSNKTTNTYTRAYGAVVVTDITAQIIAARHFALQFGRIFAVGVTPAAGSYQALGVSWNGSSGSAADWLGAGSGSELLLSQSVDPDFCVGVAPLGFDLLVLFNQKSIWFGYPTGQPNRPADFRLKEPARGCITEKTIAITPYGIVFLSVEGVCLCTANGTEILSHDINASFVDTVMGSNPLAYSGSYHPSPNRYILNIQSVFGAGIWTYTFPETGAPNEGRWSYRPSRSINRFIPFGGGGVNYPIMAQGTKLLYESTVLQTFNSVTFTPVWRWAPRNKAEITETFSTDHFEVEYKSTASGAIMLQVTDYLGNPVGASVTKTLPSTAGAFSRVKIFNLSAGMGTTLEISIVTGTYYYGPAISRVTQFVRPLGPSIQAL